MHINRCFGHTSTYIGLVAFQYMSAKLMQATSEESVSSSVKKITTIIHGMMRNRGPTI